MFAVGAAAGAAGAIGDRVWFDADKDGIQDAGEVGIPGISVQLTGDINGDSISDVTLNTVTDASGNYLK